MATDDIAEILQENYFVFVMHRQENLVNKEFVRQVVERAEKFAADKKCVLILHKITETTLAEMGILQKLKENDRFVLLSHVDYFDFMKLLNGVQYVITDGSSNQDEFTIWASPA